MKKNKFSMRLLTALLAVLMIFSVMPMSAFAAPASDIPAELLDNPILRALEYTGYDVQAQKDKGTLYQSGHYGSQLLNNDPGILSDIHYGTSTSGRETVADSSTVTGLAPDIARFENYGLCCAGFVSYFALNYLPNIEGKDTQFLTDAILATGMNSQAVVTWQSALNKLANEGKIEKVGTSSSNVDYDKMVPGDLIIFGNDESTHVHIGVYAGHYKGNAMMIHVGNDRGPEITRVDWMAQGGDKSSWPNGFYHLPDTIWEDDGDIEVYKKDTNGKALEGAVFVATNNETGNSYRIGPTNSSGYAKTENPIPYGTYTVKETVFPTNYHAYGKTEWTVTVDADNDGLVTINAVNEQDDGSVKIVKTSEDGKVEGITFTVSGNGINKTVTTNAKGEIQIDGLKPGTYTVTETVADKYEPQKSQTVTVVSNKTSTVTFNNVLKRGDLQITKTAEDGMVEGVKFHLYGTSLSGIKVDEYATTNANGVAVFKDILISGLTSYTIEEVETAEKYVIPSAQQAIIEWNDVTDNSFHNELKRGDLKITKTSEDGLVEGVKFHLYGTALNGETVDLYAVTDAMGVATFKDVLISDGNSYTVEEVDTAERYIIPASQATAIEWAKAINKEFHNELKRGDLKVTKTSEDGLVEGVTFHLYGTSLSGHTVDEYAVTNADGIAVFEDILISGHEAYTLEEVDTAERYIVPDSQRAAIEWNKVTEKSFYNKLKRGDLTVQKTSEDGFDEGMTFHLYGTSFSGIGVDEYATTDENGVAYFNDILIGTGFTIEEVNTPVRYVIPEKQSTNIYWDELTEVEFENILKKWRADVFKLDAELAGETGGEMPEELMPMALPLDSDSTIEQLGSPYGDTQGDATLGGAVYGVYKGTELIDTYTTDENGYFITKYYPCGDDWTIREITPSEGYLLDPTVYYMDASAEFYSIELNTIYPDVYEEIIKGDIAIIKHTDDGSTKIETPETGAKFTIFLKAAGSYDNAKETERDIIVCDEHGFGQTKMLPYGVYTVRQVSGWEGRELVGDFEVYISQHQTTHRYLINNRNYESHVRVVKVDAETGKTIPYAGAAFKIYDPDGELVKQPIITAPSPSLTVRTALYIRLSVEDNKKRGCSVENQKLVLNDFLADKPEFTVYDTYIDNGLTGTNFHRPGFQQMLSDIEAGLIDCVIVKDLSRLGRNSIDTGYYIEQYFYAHHVRFIAVTDQFDTADTGNLHGGIMLPLKNMINEAYALDIGRKIKAQARQAMKDGQYIGGRAPYGYRKDPNDCHKLLIDEATAPVVRQIFEWAYEQIGINNIVVRLNEMGIPSPSHYKKSTGEITHDNLIGSGKWQTRTVAKILSSEVYTGDLVQGKTKIVDHRQVKADADNLIVVHGTHEAIVSHEMFDAVQRYRQEVCQQNKEKGVKSYTPNIFKGKIFCADCGKSLHRQRDERKKGPDVYWFHCITNSRVAKGTCAGVMIQERELITTVTSILEKELSVAPGMSLPLFQLEARQKQQQDALRQRISSLRREIEKKRQLIRGLYENYVQGILTSEEYLSLKEDYEQSINALGAQIKELETEIEKLGDQLVQYRSMEKDAQALEKDHVLTAELIERLIERIEVTHEREIRVTFRFKSQFAFQGEVVKQCVNM